MLGGLNIKFSDYNLFFPHSGDSDKMIVYNSRTAATGSVDSKYLASSGLDFKESILTDVDYEYKELIQLLKIGEFVIPKEVDEKNLIRLQSLKTKFSASHLDLTIIPTSDCNFACVYCYEKDFVSNQYINKDNQEALLDFISGKASLISNLHITWYGGEPLLALSIIESLTEGILDICSRHNVQYSASMVTNGYLLSKTTLHTLRKIMVREYLNYLGWTGGNT